MSQEFEKGTILKDADVSYSASSVQQPASTEVSQVSPWGWIADGRLFHLRAAAIEAAEKTPVIDVYTSGQVTRLQAVNAALQARLTLADQRVDDLQGEVVRLQAEAQQLKAITCTSMGVGDGSGKLIVHGDYDSIKATQKILFERDDLKADNRHLRHEVASFLETMAKTCELLDIDLDSAKNAEGKPIDVLFNHARTLQSELTKALELLAHMQNYSSKYTTSPIAEYKNQIAEVLARQSAPAPKVDCGNCAFVEGVCSTGCETQRIRAAQQ